MWISAIADAVRTSRQERHDDGGSWFGGWLTDLRLAGRAIRRSPGYAFVVISTLTLAVGGVTAVFTLADPMIFRPLPYPDADRIQRVVVRGEGTFGGFGSYFDYDQVKNATTVESVGGSGGLIVGGVGDPDDNTTIIGYTIYEGYLSVLGVGPAFGRTFSAQEYAQAPDRTVTGPAVQRPALLTDAAGRRFFGSAAAAMGKSIVLRSNGQEQRLDVVGVLGRDFVYPDWVNEAPAFFVPSRLDLSKADNPRTVADIMVRLRPGVSIERATAEMSAIVTAVERDHPTVPKGRTVALMNLRTQLFSRVRTPLLMLLWATACVLALAAGNLAHLSLARSQDRAREIGVRRALGAGRWRIARLLVTESLLLASIGAAGALAFGQVLFGVVMAVVPRFGHVYRLMPASLNGRVVALGLAVTIVSAAAFGVLPALMAARRDGLVAKHSTRVRRSRRLGDEILATLQAALAVAILVTATLIVGSFVKLVNSIQGIDLEGLTSIGVALPSDAYRAPEARHQFAQSFVAGVEAATGQRIAVARGLPGVTLPSPALRGGDISTSKDDVIAYPADRTFIDDMRLELVRGRLFTLEESNHNAPVAVLDERAARFFWPEGDALGRTIDDYQTASRSANGSIEQTAVSRQVVGIVRSVDVNFSNDPGHGLAFVPIDPAGRSSDGFLWRGILTEPFKRALKAAAASVESACARHRRAAHAIRTSAWRAATARASARRARSARAPSQCQWRLRDRESCDRRADGRNWRADGARRHAAAHSHDGAPAVAEADTHRHRDRVRVVLDVDEVAGEFAVRSDAGQSSCLRVRRRDCARRCGHRVGDAGSSRQPHRSGGCASHRLIRIPPRTT